MKLPLVFTDPVSTPACPHCPDHPLDDPLSVPAFPPALGHTPGWPPPGLAALVIPAVDAGANRRLTSQRCGGEGAEGEDLYPY